MKSFPFRHLQTYDIQWVFVLTCSYSFIDSALVLYPSHRLGGIATITRKWCFLVYQLSFIGFCSRAMVASLGPIARNKQKHDHTRPYWSQWELRSKLLAGRFSQTLVFDGNCAWKEERVQKRASFGHASCKLVELRSPILIIMQT